jgi:hypothetical protein
MKPILEAKDVKQYLLYCYTNELYFSTSKGWVDKNEATVFTQLQRDSYEKPVECSYWQELEENSPEVRVVIIGIYDGEPIISQCPDDVIVKFIVHNQKYGDNNGGDNG